MIQRVFDKMITDVRDHLKETAPNNLSFELRFLHIKQMIWLMKDMGNVTDTFLTAAIFHDVCKFTNPTEHSKAAVEFIKKWNEDNKIIMDYELNEVIKLIENHSDKNHIEDFDHNQRMFIQLDILSKYTKKYVMKLIELKNGNSEAINIVKYKLDSLERKTKLFADCRWLEVNIKCELKYILEYNVGIEEYRSRYIKNSMVERMAYKLGVAPAAMRSVLKGEYLLQD